MSFFSSWRLRNKPKAAQTPSGAPPVEAAWVLEMHKHYSEKGFYRATDLARLLGDPLEGVNVAAQPTRFAARQNE